MPSLAQMYSLVNSKSLYSRSDVDIYAALSEGGFYVYSAVIKEFRGTFLKVDETSLTLVPGTTEYTLPTDLTNIVHLAERQSSSENWHPIAPEGLGDALCNIQQDLGFFDYGQNYGELSQFQFYGPYLDSTDAQNPQATQIQKIRISPQPSENRFVQIAYTAKWIPITGAGSKVMLPDEGTYAMQNYAIAECLRSNDDSLGREYEAKGDKALASFISWLRQNQNMQRATITPYLG
jgi:hypothetical protein